MSGRYSTVRRRGSSPGARRLPQACRTAAVAAAGGLGTGERQGWGRGADGVEDQGDGGVFELAAEAYDVTLDLGDVAELQIRDGRLAACRDEGIEAGSLDGPLNRRRVTCVAAPARAGTQPRWAGQARCAQAAAALAMVRWHGTAPGKRKSPQAAKPTGVPCARAWPAVKRITRRGSCAALPLTAGPTKAGYGIPKLRRGAPVSKDAVSRLVGRLREDFAVWAQRDLAAGEGATVTDPAGTRRAAPAAASPSPP